MKIKLIVILLFITTSLSGQISESNFEFLRKELTEQINQLRHSQELIPLKSDPILKKAAKIQSIFMARIKNLTHSQGNPKFNTPTKRVKHFKGYKFELVGENVLSSARVSLPLNKKDLEELAKEMFLSWKNSPGHYANMINPRYEFGGIDFQFDPSARVIYAAHVLGKKGVKIEGQLSDNGFGITHSDAPCFNNYGDYGNVIANMGNALYVQGNKVVFYYHNLDYFNEIFSNPDDGIAIDLVFRDQVPCNAPNRIDYSPVYDGIMLKPIYKWEILKNNRAESEYRIISEVGTIPDSLLSKEFSCSLVFIKNGTKCKYLIPGKVPSKQYELKPIEPKLINPSSVKLKEDGIIKSVELTYDFQSNNVIPVHYPRINKQSHSIHSIDITSFSSVEGESAQNEILHNQRAQTIKKHLSSKLNVANSKIKVDAKENWDKMYFQLRYFMANDLAELSKDSLKNLLVSDNNVLPWDSLLFDQRKSIATINYKGKFAKSADLEKYLKMNFKTAIASKHFDLANKALFEMYNNDLGSANFLFEEVVFKSILENPEMTQNVAAIFSKTYQRDYSKTVEFLFNWLNRENELSTATKFNLLNLYALVASDLLAEWDVPSQRLSNVVHPLIVQKLISDELDNELMLNLNLSFIQYFGQTNDAFNINKSFDFITKYFKAKILKEEDIVNLALFFNSWSSYDLTNAFLFDKFIDDELNEDAVFILLKTMNFYTKDEIEKSKLEEVYLKALELNEQKWCEWVGREFQILRDVKIKDLFCSRCGDR